MRIIYNYIYYTHTHYAATATIMYIIHTYHAHTYHTCRDVSELRDSNKKRGRNVYEYTYTAMTSIVWIKSPDIRYRLENKHGLKHEVLCGAYY